MKLIKTIKIDNAVIDVWKDKYGYIILGGIGWYEYNEYTEKFGKESKE